MSIDPKALLEEMCKNANPRKERSLRLIYAICEEQHQRGSKDYSVVTIGRLSNERDGPSAAAIRNKTGEEYRALMKVFADNVGGHSRKVVQTKQDEVDEILEGIMDPVLRTRLNLLLAEVKSMRAQLLATRHLASQTACIRIEQPRASGNDPTQPELMPKEAPVLDALEKRALQAAISERTLAHWGWTRDQTGRVLSDTGQVVFQAGFISGIEKVLAAT